MSGMLRKLLLSSLIIGVLIAAIPMVAGAAKGHRGRSARATSLKASKSATAPKGGNGETPLTGATLASASAAALAAAPGGTVKSATTETDGDGAYEVIVTKSDGTQAKVVENAGFTVLSTGASSCH